MSDYQPLIEVILHGLPDTQAIYLFGSAARNEMRPVSDIDLAVLLPFATAKQAGSLAMSQTHLNLAVVARRDVDLINLRQVSAVLQAEVASTGRIIFCTDTGAQQEFEMTALSALQELNRHQFELLQQFMTTKRAYAV